MDYERYMELALKLALEAADSGETPVGCVIADDKGDIIGRGRNRTEEIDATCHAEMEAIRRASESIRSWRLEGCTMFVTMEPCPMCAGAILNARISRLVFGARDRRFGACGGVLNLFMEGFGRSPQVYGGVLEERCVQVLSDFYRQLRRKDSTGTG